MRLVALVLAALLGVALGVAAVLYGGVDDSPGLQLIGVAIVLGTIVLTVRAVRRHGPGSTS